MPDNLVDLGLGYFGGLNSTNLSHASRNRHKDFHLAQRGFLLPPRHTHPKLVWGWMSGETTPPLTEQDMRGGEKRLFCLAS